MHNALKLYSGNELVKKIVDSHDKLFLKYLFLQSEEEEDCYVLAISREARLSVEATVCSHWLYS